MKKSERLRLESGAIIVNKAVGSTSRAVDDFCLHQLGYRKVGHLGTLDPFASGILIIFTNAATKLIPFFEDLPKEYVATLKLGIRTDSGDLSGKIVQKGDVLPLDATELGQYFAALVGTHTQIPPMYSALKKDGVPLYKLARSGTEVERKPRTFEIYESELLDYQNDEITFRVVVSKGTYIRTLGEDIAQHFQMLGHLTKLVRTQVGPFKIDGSHQLLAIDDTSLIPMATLLATFPSHDLDDFEYQQARLAKPLALKNATRYVLIKYNNEPLALYERGELHYHFKKGLR